MKMPKYNKKQEKKKNKKKKIKIKKKIIKFKNNNCIRINIYKKNK